MLENRKRRIDDQIILYLVSPPPTGQSWPQQPCSEQGVCRSKKRHIHEDQPIVRAHSVKKEQRTRAEGHSGTLPKAASLSCSVILLSHYLFLLGSALAIVPKTRRSLSKATLQIHEAWEPHKLGICIIITGRRKRGTLYHWKG